MEGIFREDMMLKIDPPVFLHFQLEFFFFFKFLKTQLYCYVSREAQKVGVSGDRVGSFYFYYLCHC